jgi:non-ribosomal peptide synthetase component F
MPCLEDLRQEDADGAAAGLRISDEERKRVLYEFNDMEAAHRDERLIQELFERQVEQTPNALALVYMGRSITYAGLNRQANQLARFLREGGVGPDRLVGLCYER